MTNQVLTWLLNNPKRSLGILAGLIVLIALIISGGSRVRLTDNDAANILGLVIANTTNSSGNHSPLYRAADPNTPDLQWKVHVDLSASMGGYVNPEKSEFKAVLDRMHTRAAAQFVPAGEFEAGPGAKTEPTGFFDYLKPAFYIRAGVNYSNAFETFLSETNFNHILLTDGVLVQNGQLLSPKFLSDLLKRLLSGGGQFALLAARGSYDGTYTSVALRGRLPPNAPRKDYTLEIRTNSRPFLLWIFMQPGQDLDSASAYLGKLTAVLGTEYSRAIVQGLGSSLSDADSVQGLRWEPLIVQGQPRLRASLVRSELVGPGGSKGKDAFTDLFPLDPSPFALTCQATIYSMGEPARFNFDTYCQVGPVTNDSPAAIDDAAKEGGTNTLVSLARWELKRIRNKQAESWQLRDLRGSVAAPEWVRATNSVPTNGMLKLRLVLPEAQPELLPDNKDYLIAWMLTLRLNPSSEQRVRWNAFSTEDDSREDAGGRIYRLNDFLEVIHEDCVVNDRLVFFTYWPR